ncbi:MAG: outer membrane protein transport protein [Candidatus Aminicenantes bacterium]|nr:MAG: outer membrane protein transport protein [Candidatus Aminicenantes bacterium]
MKRIIAVSIFCLIFLTISTLSHSAGFLIYEHGAAAMAMAGAFVAIANNPTAIFHNPAGLAWLEGTQINFGTTLITSIGDLSLPNYALVDPTFNTTVEREKKWFYPPTFYISHKISDSVVAGFGFFVPYGLGITWPEDYPLKYISVRDDMKALIFNPTVAFKVNENFSLGFGVSYIYSTLEFELVERDEDTLPGSVVGLPFPAIGSYTVEIPVLFDATGSAWGLNAGALYKGENFSLGFNWRGGFKIDFDGNLELSAPDVNVQLLPPFDQLLPPGTAETIETVIATQVPSGGTASTSFNFPHIFGVGLAFNLTESLIMSADVHYLLWSTYDEFTVAVEVPGFDDKHVKENWEDSFVFRGGLEYNLNENLALRAGFLYDQTPQPDESVDPILPDSERWAVTGGFGYKSGNFVLNVAYQFEPFKDRESENRYFDLNPQATFNPWKGTYKTTAHLIGVSLGFVF